jgi:PAS domain S-box-containing protein
MIKDAMDKRSKDTNDKARILIVDDEESARRSMSLIFRVKGYEAETASTGQEALEKARERFFNVTLLDIRLPDMEGIDLLAPLKKMHPDMAVIMATGYASMETSVRALHNGASAYITKPLNMDEVLNRVKEALEKQRLVFDNRRLIKALQQELAERKQTEEALRVSEERYRKMFESMSNAVAVYEAADNGEDFILKDFNNAAESIEKVKRKDIIGKSVLKVFPGVKEFGLFEVFQRVWKSGKPEHHPISLYKDDRIAGWRENYVYKLPSGEIVAIYEDITERKQAEEALRDREESYRELANSITDIFFAMDKDLRYTYWNKASEILSGIAAKDALGKSRYDIFPHVKGAKAEEMYLKVLKTRRSQHFIDNYCLGVKGNFFEINAYPSKGGISVFARDITERTKAEEALQESEEKYRTLTENINVGVYRNTSGLQGKFIEANPAIIKMFGYKSKKEFMAVNVSDLYQHPADRKKFNDVILKQGFVKDKELLLKKKDGTPFIGSISAKAVKDKIGNVLYYDGIIEDITRRKKAEEELKLEERRLKVSLKLSQMKDISENEIINFSLEEAVKLTRSKIGYLHFVNEDQKSLSSYSWSKDVFKKCTAEKGSNYPLNKAGVWVDCVRQKRPLIHNDYQNLPDKRGYPEGHIHVERHMSVPIFDHNKIIAVIGVGNKIEPYDQSDIHQLSLFINHMWEILKRKKAEQALQKSEEMYRVLVETSPEAVTSTDLEGKILYASKQTLKRHGYKSEKELLGKGAYSLIAPEDREKAIKNLQKTLKTGIIRDLEYTLLKKDGTRFPGELSAALIRDASGNPTSFMAVTRDITMRKEAEQKLRESEKRFKAIFDNARDGMLLADVDGKKFLAGNKMICRMLGYNQEEIKNLGIMEIHPEKDLPYVLEQFEKQSRKEITLARNIPVKRKDGSIFYADISSSHIKLDDKTYLLGIFRDITEHRQMQEALRKSEEKYRTIFENTGLAMVIIEEDTTLSLVNDKFERLSGYSQNEIEGKKSWTEFVVKEDLERMKKYHRERRVDKASAPNNYEFRFIDRSGNIRDIFLSIAIIPGTKSSVGSLLDITENRRAEEALRKSEASLAEAQRIALLGSWEWDIINDQIIGSLQFYRIFNMEPNEFGTRFQDLLNKVHPEDREFVEASLSKTFDKKRSFTIHYRISLPDGSERIIRKQAEVIVNEAGKAIRMVGTVQDVTERMTLEQQLIQSEKLASLGHLAAGIAHEINNPLGFISSNLSTLDEYVQDIKKYFSIIEELDNTGKSEPDKLTGFLDKLLQEKEKLEIDLILDDIEKMKVETRDGINRISSLVRDLKRFAHPMEESPQLANINELIDTSLNLVKNELKYKAKVIKDYEDIPSIKCYPQQLNQVFNNILINAAQATKEKGEVGIKTFSEDESIYIQIKDNGEGIAKENITKIFDPFFTTKKVGIGTGLGLSISLRIIEKHKGSINVQSTVGKGTTFTIKLPLKGLD